MERIECAGWIDSSCDDGPGVRSVLFLQGCRKNCKGCHNQNTWGPNGGFEITQKDIDEMFEELSKPWVDGLTFSGGHPLETYNIDKCTEIAKKFKEKFPNKTIWLYTGWLWENVKGLPIMDYIDVIVDRPYIDELRDISLPYCGSKNQRVIDVQRSLQENILVFYEAP